MGHWNRLKSMVFIVCVIHTRSNYHHRQSLCFALLKPAVLIEPMPISMTLCWHNNWLTITLTPQLVSFVSLQDDITNNIYGLEHSAETPLAALQKHYPGRIIRTCDSKSNELKHYSKDFYGFTLQALLCRLWFTLQA